jgi:hypothetical protein
MLNIESTSLQYLDLRIDSQDEFINDVNGDGIEIEQGVKGQRLSEEQQWSSPLMPGWY